MNELDDRTGASCARNTAFCLARLALAACCMAGGPAGAREYLPRTDLYTGEGDLAEPMLDGIARFLLERTERSVAGRAAHWNRDLSSPEAYEASIRPNRERFRRLIGAVDAREPVPSLELVATTSTRARLAETEAFTVWSVRWPVFGPITGEGLLLEPKSEARACVVALPDADHSPEIAAGLLSGVPGERQFARRLAENGCRVLVPTLIDRRDEFSGNELVDRFTNQPHREWTYRQAFQMGRHVIGYEVQKVLAGVDWFIQDSWQADAEEQLKIGVAGYGEGGLIALYAAAVDPRIDAALVSVTPYATTAAAPGSQRFSSYMFTGEYEIMEFDLGHTFNYAEMAAMIAPRPFMVERGHRDLVASDEWVAFEYAAVRRHYTDLGIPEQTEIEYFDDGHVIHGEGTFRFLHRHLQWPEP